MGGMFAVASKTSSTLDLFFGTDYHSHLGTRRGGMAVYNGKGGFSRSIHNIENTPFRTKFDKELDELEGTMGIGCISDTEPQPLLINSRLGSYAITTVGKISNEKELVTHLYDNGYNHFQEMSNGLINSTEIVSALINLKDNFIDGISYAQSLIKGSMSILLLTKSGIYAARDLHGRTPLIVGKKEDSHCISFEDFAYVNLGFTTQRELGPAEIVFMTHDEVKTLSPPKNKMKICAFLWVYYGYPTSSYEGVNVESMRYECGKLLAKRDNVAPDCVAGIPDSGIAHAIGYSTQSGIPFSRPFIKYTPTWPRSFMPPKQADREVIAKMKLVPIDTLIRDKSLLLIDDSIVRGTQLGETTEFLYTSGAKEVHIRTACPPLLFGCKYLNFSRSSSDMDMITRRVIKEIEGSEVSNDTLLDYANPDSDKYYEMVEGIRRKLNFTTLQYQRLDDLISSISINPSNLCTYCWSGLE